MKISLEKKNRFAEFGFSALVMTYKRDLETMHKITKIIPGLNITDVTVFNFTNRIILADKEGLSIV